MDPSSGKLFGAIGEFAPNDEKPALGFSGGEPEFSRWYTQQWLKSQGFRVNPAVKDGNHGDAL